MNMYIHSICQFQDERVHQTRPQLVWPVPSGQRYHQHSQRVYVLKTPSAAERMPLPHYAKAARLPLDRLRRSGPPLLPLRFVLQQGTVWFLLFPALLFRLDFSPRHSPNPHPITEIASRNVRHGSVLSNAPRRNNLLEKLMSGDLL